jgi:hypothetical protein
MGWLKSSSGSNGRLFSMLRLQQGVPIYIILGGLGTTRFGLPAKSLHAAVPECRMFHSVESSVIEIRNTTSEHLK